jgi:hypothetical protein
MERVCEKMKAEVKSCSGSLGGGLGLFGGQFILWDKVEKNGFSPKTWYRAIFRVGKFELAANQNDPPKNERNQTLKFLQFLENFSGGILSPRGGPRCSHHGKKAKG